MPFSEIQQVLCSFCNIKVPESEAEIHLEDEAGQLSGICIPCGEEVDNAPGVSVNGYYFTDESPVTETPKKMFLRIWTKAEMSEENFWKNRTRADWCEDLETAASEYWMERDCDKREVR